LALLARNWKWQKERDMRDPRKTNELVHLWFSSFDPWKETIKSDIDGEKQYEKIRPEVALGSPTFSPVYSGCYFWDITEVVNGELRKTKR
jgi:hypothetical protein